MARTRIGELGDQAEQFAFRYLTRRGLTPVARNFRTRRGEIDLVMLDGECLVFVEVRYRSGNSFVPAAHTVDARKQRKLADAAAMFLSMNARFHARTCRFDVVGIDRHDDGGIGIDWLRDAFRQ